MRAARWCSANRWPSVPGELESFIVDGRALSGADLDRCNTSAKAPQTSALAAQ